MSNLAASLREFIKENFLFGGDDSFSDDDSFLDLGIVDSTGVLELITHLEETYDIVVEDTDLVPENLDSITNLQRFITSKSVGALT
ncbi:MAG: acyl carrier protein [Candidatus Nealsonbacteria bacterium]|nr:acyl carrier protein [Candidatus Nealsonbacteria bacterium]